MVRVVLGHIVIGYEQIVRNVKLFTINLNNSEKSNMMKIDEITCFCRNVRTVLEKMEKRDHVWGTSLYLSDFPAGCCGDTSKILAYLLHRKFKIDPEIISGTYYEFEHTDISCSLINGMTHSWLKVNDYIIDLTADQFLDSGYDNPSVMITTDSAFHDLFSNRLINKQSEVTLSEKLRVTASNIQKALRERG